MRLALALFMFATSIFWGINCSAEVEQNGATVKAIMLLIACILTLLSGSMLTAGMRKGGRR